LVEDLDDLQFVLAGDGIALPQLQAIAAEHELSNVRFLGRYPASFMVHLYALSDILLLHLKDDPLFRITIPHKLFAYMASGKPILAGAAGDVADLLRETRAGIAVPPQDAPALAAAVRDLYHLRAEERAAIAERGLQSARCHYSRKALIGEIEQILLSQSRATAQGDSE
jgi:colanic acid biosynthesis glycosyl transferase WcaI